MPKYKKTNITNKKGVNFVRGIVEDAGSLFHKIEQENDLGIDGIIEFIKAEIPANKSIAVQIKAGKSYFNPHNTESLIPVDDHYEYWNNYPLPVYGLVYSPELKKGYWVNIKDYFKRHGKCSVIKYTNNKTNEFDLDSFTKLFSPMILKETPDLSFEEALSLFDSKHYDEVYLGMIVLFRRFVNQKIIWEKFLSYFVSHDVKDIPYLMIYYFAHIPWHGDIAYRGEPISRETKQFMKQQFNEFDKASMIKLLEFIDEEGGISRGSIGQSVEAIISSMTNFGHLLKDIIKTSDLPILVRHSAALIVAYHEGREAIAFLKTIPSTESWLIPEIIKDLEEFGEINLY